MARRVKTRDYSMLQLILGATKAGIHRDNSKHADANACRGDKKMFAARKNPRYDIKMEWTRNAEHGGVEVFDIYGVKLQPHGWHVVRCDFIDEDGEPVSFNMSSFSDEEELAIQNALQDEWEGLSETRH
jgi:hypothetical protein